MVNPSYQWSNGDTTSFTIISTSGNFSVSATDSLGCENTDSIQINAHPLPIIYVTGGTPVLPGTVDTLKVAGADTYAWSTGSTYDTTIVAPIVTTTFTVVGTDTNGCQDAALFIVEVDSTLNLADYSKEENIIMYPNPAAQKIHFEFDDNTKGKTTIKIVNLAGKTVVQKELNLLGSNTASINIENLNTGMYMVEIISD